MRNDLVETFENGFAAYRKTAPHGDRLVICVDNFLNAYQRQESDLLMSALTLAKAAAKLDPVILDKEAYRARGRKSCASD